MNTPSTHKLTWRERLRGYITVAPQPITTPALVVGQWNGMTLREWEASDTHVLAMQKLFRESVFRDALAVLANMRPALALPSDRNHAFELGRRVGYDELLATLLRLPVMPPRPAPDVPTDYGALGAQSNVNTALDDEPF